MELNFYTPQYRQFCKWKSIYFKSLGKIYRDCFELPEFAIDLDKAYLD